MLRASSFKTHQLLHGSLLHPRLFRLILGRSLTNTRRCASKSSKSAERINYNDSSLFEDPSTSKGITFEQVTANELEKNDVPPRSVKMLVRDFIEDSLYNPSYGYFSKHATIFTTTEKSFDFNSMRDLNEFDSTLAKKYSDYGIPKAGLGRQIWHTPTEIFKPWYGQAIAQCLVSEYLLKYFPYEDFIIYEIGAGNGTLAMDILDIIQSEHPDVYERTQYTIVEISAQLAKLQEKRLSRRHPAVKVVRKSIFHWNIHEPAPCYFIALEVLDNFAHDMIRYDLRTLEPYQGFIAIDENGDYSTHFTPVSDPLISSFLTLRQRLHHSPPVSSLLRYSQTLRKVLVNLPFAPNLSKPEFIPTRQLSLLQCLRLHFPLHRLLISDFASLPDTIAGYNSPVVQTRYQNSMIPCSTLLVGQGYFDIFFPTNFERLRDMYEFILSQPLKSDNLLSSTLPIPRVSPMAGSASPLALGADFFSSYNRRSPLDGIRSASGLPIGEHKSSVYSHAEFLSTYANIEKTRVQSGENPMLDLYKNVKFLF